MGFRIGLEIRAPATRPLPPPEAPAAFLVDRLQPRFIIQVADDARRRIPRNAQVLGQTISV